MRKAQWWKAMTPDSSRKIYDFGLITQTGAIIYDDTCIVYEEDDWGKSEEKAIMYNVDER